MPASFRELSIGEALCVPENKRNAFIWLLVAVYPILKQIKFVKLCVSETERGERQCHYSPSFMFWNRNKAFQ
jgi:hypothetical protein